MIRGGISILLFWASMTQAQQQDTTYIIAGRLVDVVKGRILENQVIVIFGERIFQVRPASEIRVPTDANQIDLSGATVLPGLIDAHAHLTHSPELHGYKRLGRSAVRAALYGAFAARQTLEAGFTTVRNLGAAGYGDVALKEAINEGNIPGPRMIVSGPSLGMTGSHCNDGNNLLPSEYGHFDEAVADGPWTVRQQVRKNLKYGADVIKFCATGGVLSSRTRLGARQYTLEEMKALVDEAHTLGVRVAAHAHGVDGIKAAIQAGVNSVEHASILDEEAITLALRSNTTFVMDIYVSDWILQSGAESGILPESLDKERKVGKRQRESFRQAHQAGVRIVFGTDAGVYPHGKNGRQFTYMVEYGMTTMEAIQAATVHAAELLGWADRVGRISSGYFADLIAVNGNPLDEIHLLEDVGFVMKGGEIYSDRLSND